LKSEFSYELAVRNPNLVAAKMRDEEIALAREQAHEWSQD
jgi:hypothetical protein